MSQPHVGIIDPMRVEIRMKNGKSYSMGFQHPLGYPQRPLSRETIMNKFRDNVAYTAKTTRILPREKGEEIIALIENLEELETTNEIVELVATTN